MRNAKWMVGVALLAAGCGETKLLDRSLPDETRVIDGPSLAVPPSMDLRPPREAEDYETVLRAQKTVEGQALITGVSASSVVSGSEAVPGGDQWILQQTGAQADPNVRAELEAAAKNPE
jgi:hypothetical protein